MAYANRDIIIISCSIDAGDENKRSTTLSESYHSHFIMSMVTADYITVTEGAPY